MLQIYFVKINAQMKASEVFFLGRYSLEIYYKSLYGNLLLLLCIFSQQIPLDVETGNVLKPKSGVFVKFEPRMWSNDCC